jgi:hypothetical protein
MGRRSLLLGFTLLGAALVAIAAVLQSRDSQRRAAAPPAPAWHSADRTAAYLQSQLEPLAAGDSASTRRALAGLRACQFLDTTPGSATLHMTRSMDSGHEFDAVIGVNSRPAATGQDLEFALLREDQEPIRLRVEVRAGAVAAVHHAGRDATAWEPWNMAADLPLALGDLQIAEALALGHAFAAGTLQPLGVLRGLGARPQIVFETTRFAAAETGEKDAGNAAAARALVYVDLSLGRLRSVRVLDADGYVVRVYEDLTPVAADAMTRIAAFRVTSRPSSSHTVFRRVASATN